jgi:hypothetical protein
VPTHLLKIKKHNIVTKRHADILEQCKTTCGMTLTLCQVADCETEGRDLTSLQVIMPAGGKISATAYEKAGGGGLTTNHNAGVFPLVPQYSDLSRKLKSRYGARNQFQEPSLELSSQIT